MKSIKKTILLTSIFLLSNVPTETLADFSDEAREAFDLAKQGDTKTLDQLIEQFPEVLNQLDDRQNGIIDYLILTTDFDTVYRSSADYVLELLSRKELARNIDIEKVFERSSYALSVVDKQKSRIDLSDDMIPQIPRAPLVKLTLESYSEVYKFDRDFDLGSFLLTISDLCNFKKLQKW